MGDLGVGLIGCGNISATYLRLAPLFDHMEIRAVADRDGAVAEARAADHGVEARSVEALLASDDIQIVVNLTVPQAHFEVTRRILDAGKHAYSEKPYVLSLKEGVALRGLAEDRGLRVGSAPDTFLGGAHQLARAALDEGQAGQIVGGTCHVMSRGMEGWHPNPDFFFQPGGGPVLDLGPYYITNLVQLLGPVRAVTAMAGAGFATRRIGSGPRAGERVAVETPTNVHGLLEFAGGALITLGASWDVRAHGHGPMELYGTEATLNVPDPNFFGGVVERADGAGEVTEMASRDHPFDVANETGDDGVARANYRGAGLADMAAGIVQDRPHRCALDLATHVVEVMTALLQSAEERRWIEMTTECARPAQLGPEAARALLRG
ncbi:MAG: Gfo/Idh/MocA family oxidoreductase [Silicimonas sp.]|nr:Gfo/Idh/MocA family oxidoreductase [Silicimonas sp.]